jgi:hypothetical protein
MKNMKKSLLYCLIGLGLLLPSIAAKSVVAKSSIVTRSMKTISGMLEGANYIINSDTKSGQLQSVVIIDLDTQQEVVDQQLSGYKGEVNLGGLPTGHYQSQIYAQYGQLQQDFSL